MKFLDYRVLDYFYFDFGEVIIKVDYNGYLIYFFDYVFFFIIDFFLWFGNLVVFCKLMY